MNSWWYTLEIELSDCSIRVVNISYGKCTLCILSELVNLQLYSLPASTASYSQKLLTYDAISGCFMTIKLRPRQPSCKGCGEHSQLSPTIDYVQWCGSGPDDKGRV